MLTIESFKKNEFFNIKILSIGGLGAYTMGQMFGVELSKYNNLQTTTFASYSSEKKGTPVNVFIKILNSDKPIRDFSAIKKTNVLIVFKEELLKDKNNLVGIDQNTIILINSHKNVDDIINIYELPAKHIYTIDATKISIKHNSKINMIMFGAIHKIFSFLTPHQSAVQISEKLKARYQHLIQKNVDAFHEGFANTIYHQNTLTFPIINDTIINIGFDNQLEGGVILGANTFLLDRSISREGYIPSFNQELCINCTKCDFTCPDDCFIWEEKEGRRGRMEMVLTGINYQYCKGCMRCVNVCPTQALTQKIEINLGEENE